MKKEEAIERFNGIINAMSISIAQSKFYPSKAELDELCDMAIKSLQKDIERHEMVIRASERHLNIVRCKNCKHRSDGGWCDVYIQPRMDTDFCNHGEYLCNHDWRKGGDNE